LVAERSTGAFVLATDSHLREWPDVSDAFGQRWPG
jgi:hypothetical protein